MATDTALSGQVVAGNGPARRAMPWRRVVCAVMGALVPLPAVLLCDAWLLRAAYTLMDRAGPTHASGRRTTHSIT